MPIDEKFYTQPEYRHVMTFYDKSFSRLLTVRRMELDLHVPEKEMQSMRIFRLLDKWKNRQIEIIKSKTKGQ